MEKINGKPFRILLVEDNSANIRLTEEALEFCKINHELLVSEDGGNAMKLLRRQGEFSRAPRPDIILLDLNLPKKNGREVLEEVKKDKNLRKIPIIVLTTSKAEEDIVRCYNLHANCYITKPVDLNQFFQVIKLITEFWWKIVKLSPSNLSNYATI